MILSDRSAPLAPGGERVDDIASCAEDDDEKEALRASEIRHNTT